MNAAILNGGAGADLFEPLAQRLASALLLPISPQPAAYNYVLAWDDDTISGRSFIPLDAIKAASDKRIMAVRFPQNDVNTPATHLLETESEVHRLLRCEPQSRWVLKWPTGCGAAGHRLLEADAPIPPFWPRPYVLQRFIAMDRPEVYRLYAVAGETFGWNVRRFPPDALASPFVAHARGARYEAAGRTAPGADEQARRALSAMGLFDSFGCVDLLPDGNGGWLVLEVNTDGVFACVDRDIDVPSLAREIDERIAQAFRRWITSSAPAGPGG